MTGRNLLMLRGLRDSARHIGKQLERREFSEPRISLSIGEALTAVSRLEAFLADAVDTAEAELYKGPL